MRTIAILCPLLLLTVLGGVWLVEEWAAAEARGFQQRHGEL